MSPDWVMKKIALTFHVVCVCADEDGLCMWPTLLAVE